MEEKTNTSLLKSVRLEKEKKKKKLTPNQESFHALGDHPYHCVRKLS